MKMVLRVERKEMAALVDASQTASGAVEKGDWMIAGMCNIQWPTYMSVLIPAQQGRALSAAQPEVHEPTCWAV